MSDDQWGAGDKSNWSHHGTVIVGNYEYPLIYGQHPHSRRDDRHYVDMGGEEPEAFDGHRVLIDVRIKSRNYLKGSHLSGSEVLKGGSAIILADGVQVFEFFFRDPQYALLKAHRLISKLSEHSSSWLMKKERERLAGRQIYYREAPAVIDHLIVDQGCLIIKTADGQPFPKPVYSDDDWGDDKSPTAKVEVTDPHIWWFRDVKEHRKL